MRLGASLFLIAIGAILKFAVTDSIRGVNLGVVGVVLMIVGAVGLLAELFIWSTHRHRDVVVRDERYVDGRYADGPYGTPRY
jgi:hypothetical protein